MLLYYSWHSICSKWKVDWMRTICWLFTLPPFFLCKIKRVHTSPSVTKRDFYGQSVTNMEEMRTCCLNQNLYFTCSAFLLLQRGCGLFQLLWLVRASLSKRGLSVRARWTPHSDSYTHTHHAAERRVCCRRRGGMEVPASALCTYAGSYANSRVPH